MGFELQTPGLQVKHANDSAKVTCDGNQLREELLCVANFVCTCER